MVQLNIKKDKKENAKNLKFNLAEVILIMLVTSICTITLTIKVTYRINNTPNRVKLEADLSEFINIYDSITNNYYKDIDKKELLSSAIEAMVNTLDDPYSAYLDKDAAESFNQELNGEYEGIGAKIKLSSNKFVINEVFEGGPCEQAGLKVNDIILKIGGIAIDGKTLNEVSTLIKEKNNEAFEMVISRDSKEISVTIKKSKIDLKSVDFRIINKDKTKIGLVTIDVFAKNTFEQFEKIAGTTDFNEVSTLIIDLRNNKGGYLTSAISVAELFLNKGDTIYQTSTKNGTDKKTNDKKPSINKNVILLVNENTASASEILTATFKENLNAEVIGVKTYGKGKVQQTQTLSDGSIVKFTIENWLTPKGEKIDEKGIEPTIEVKLDNKYYKNPTDDNDLQLQKALEIALKTMNKKD